MIQNVVQQMRIEALPLNMHEWSADWDLELPPGHGVCIPKLDVVAITEASSQLAAGVGPQVVRTLYRSYTQSFVWAGFNGKRRVTGSKLLLAEPDHFGFFKSFLSVSKSGTLISNTNPSKTSTSQWSTVRRTSWPATGIM